MSRSPHRLYLDGRVIALETCSDDRRSVHVNEAAAIGRLPMPSSVLPEHLRATRAVLLRPK